MLMDDAYRLTLLMKRAQEMGIETTMDNLSEFRDSVRATKLHAPDDVYAQLDLVQAVAFMRRGEIETCDDPVQKKELHKDIIYLKN